MCCNICLFVTGLVQLNISRLQSRKLYKFLLLVFLTPKAILAQTYLQLPLRQWGAGNVYLLVLPSWKVDIAVNPIVVMWL